MSTKIRFSCDSCGRALSAEAEKVGKKIRCPDCQTAVTIPSESAQSAKKPARRPKESDEQPDAEAQQVEQPVRRKKRSGGDEANDIWSQPLSSYSSPAIEEHEYEQLGIQPKRPRVQTQDNGSAMTLTGPMVFFAVGMVVSIAAIALAFAAPKAGQITGYVAAGLGGLLSVIGHWKIRETAFEESSSCGLKYNWVPFYQPYYIISRFSYVKIPFLVSVLGNIVLFVGVTGLVLANIQLEKAAGG